MVKQNRIGIRDTNALREQKNYGKEYRKKNSQNKRKRKSNGKLETSGEKKR